jgi:chitinase
VDICPTGLTTVSTTYTTMYYPASTTPVVPVGWTTTVTVCKHCGPKPTTLTLTKPVSSAPAKPVVTSATSYATTKEAKVTMTIVPVPEKEYYSSLSAAGKPIPSSVSVVSSFPVKPVVQSSVLAKPVEASTYKPVYGTAAPTGYATKTSSGPYVQFTGAANKLNVGAGVAVGLVAAVLAM